MGSSVGLVGAVLFLSGGSHDPAWLDDPLASARHAKGAARVEALLLAQQPEKALAALRQDGLVLPDETRDRLRAYALAGGDRPRAARVAIERLAEARWASVRTHLRSVQRRSQTRQLVERIGLWLFAGPFALLALGGSSALLSIRRSLGGIVVLGTALSVASAFALVPRLGPVILVLGTGAALLVHAADAARRRTRAGPRGRTLLAVLVILGMSGEALAILARLDPVVLLNRTLGLQPAEPGSGAVDGG